MGKWVATTIFSAVIFPYSVKAVLSEISRTKVFSYIFRKPNEVFYRRLCLLKPYRRLGYGKLIFSYFENLFLSQVRPLRIYFHGEKYLKEYWIKLGYTILHDVSEGESSPPLLLVEKIIK